MSRDARVSLWTGLAKIEQERAAAEKRAAVMADLKARGIIKDRTPEEAAEAEKQREALIKKELEDGVPWLMIVGIVMGILAIIVALAAGIIYGVMYLFPDVSLAWFGSECVEV